MMHTVSKKLAYILQLIITITEVLCMWGHAPALKSYLFVCFCKVVIKWRTSVKVNSYWELTAVNLSQGMKMQARKAWKV